MKYKAPITDTTTGETRTHEIDVEDRYVKTQAFWWSRRQGNGGCDCNRGLMFAQSGGVDTDAMTDEEMDEQWPCGHSRFSVPYLEWEDGTRTAIDG